MMMLTVLQYLTWDQLLTGVLCVTTSAAAAVDSDMALLWIAMIFKVDLPCKHRRDEELSTVMLLNNIVNNGRM